MFFKVKGYLRRLYDFCLRNLNYEKWVGLLLLDELKEGWSLVGRGEKNEF